MKNKQKMLQKFEQNLIMRTMIKAYVTVADPDEVEKLFKIVFKTNKLPKENLKS